MHSNEVGLGDHAGEIIFHKGQEKLPRWKSLHQIHRLPHSVNMDGDKKLQTNNNRRFTNNRSCKWFILLIIAGCFAMCVLCVGAYILVTKVLPLLGGPECEISNCAECKKDYCSECEQGWYGLNCSLSCSHCWHGKCKRFDGTCLYCQPGFYTESCDMPCPQKCRLSIDGYRNCDRKTGHCDEGCMSSYWGVRCTERCSPRCGNVSCLQDNGVCIHGCQDGWYGEMCESKCPEHCVDKCSHIRGDCSACQYGFHGLRCNVTCHNCIDVDCRYNGLTEEVTCTKGCKPSWTSQDCHDKCNDRCKNGVCEVDGKCQSCIDGYYGDRCQYSCPSECSNGQCSANGNCKSCRNGFYGEKCQHHCPSGCKHGTCLRNGDCQSCFDGFYGDKCFEHCSERCKDNICERKGSCHSCINGYYGNRCQNRCPLKCKGGICTGNGNCDSCIDGYHGYRCQDICPNGCIKCNRLNGQCQIRARSAGSKVTGWLLVINRSWMLIFFIFAFGLF